MLHQLDWSLIGEIVLQQCILLNDRKPIFSVCSTEWTKAVLYVLLALQGWGGNGGGDLAGLFDFGQ